MTNEVREYPRYVYHKNKAPVIVYSPDDEKKLKGKWADSPAAFKEKDEDEDDVAFDAPKPAVFELDDKHKELDIKTKHDLEKTMPGLDDEALSGFTDQDKAPDEKQTPVKPKL